MEEYTIQTDRTSLMPLRSAPSFKPSSIWTPRLCHYETQHSERRDTKQFPYPALLIFRVTMRHEGSKRDADLVLPLGKVQPPILRYRQALR